MNRFIKIFLCFILISVTTISGDFWEKNKFTADVSETITVNKGNKTKTYTMVYDNGTLKLTINSPKVNKGEVYTYSGSKKIIYYPSLKQTVTQTATEDELNMLGVLNKLRKLPKKSTQTINGETFKFENAVLTSIKGKNYTANFSSYKTVNGIKYPSEIKITDGNSTAIYRFSNMR